MTPEEHQAFGYYLTFFCDHPQTQELSDSCEDVGLEGLMDIACQWWRNDRIGYEQWLRAGTPTAERLLSTIRMPYSVDEEGFLHIDRTAEIIVPWAS